jgi:hypothetical protein
MLATVLLVLHAVGSWAYSALGTPAALVSAGLVAAVSVFSARMAGLGEGNSAWFVVPTMVFTVLPLGARLWTLATAEEGWWARSIEFGPFLIGFAAPVLLLLTAYLELGRRARRSGLRAVANMVAEPTPNMAVEATRVSSADAARIPGRQPL